MKKLSLNKVLVCLSILFTIGSNTIIFANETSNLQKHLGIFNNSPNFLLPLNPPTGCISGLGLLTGNTFHDIDCKSDFTIWRPQSPFSFWSLGSQNGNVIIYPIGQAGDKPLGGDYDNDGITDWVLYRMNGQQGWWHIQTSTEPSPPPVKFGQLEYDMPIPADYDGDKRTDVAVFRVEEIETCETCQRLFKPYFYCQFAPNNLCSSYSFDPHETDRLLPVVADYDGDEKADIAIRIQDTGQWLIYNSGNDQLRSEFLGDAHDIPVPGNYKTSYSGGGTADGIVDLAVWKRSNGTWYIKNSSGGSQTIQFGLSTDDPVPADYDGDGILDIAVRRPHLNNGSPQSYYYVIGSSVGYFITQFGNENDKPVGFPSYFFRDELPLEGCPTGMCKDMCPIICG